MLKIAKRITNKILKLRKLNLSYKDIGLVVKLSPSTVERFCKVDVSR